MVAAFNVTDAEKTALNDHHNLEDYRGPPGIETPLREHVV
jgi:hypothetical protein